MTQTFSKEFRTMCQFTMSKTRLPHKFYASLFGTDCSKHCLQTLLETRVLCIGPPNKAPDFGLFERRRLRLSRRHFFAWIGRLHGGRRRSECDRILGRFRHFIRFSSIIRNLLDDLAIFREKQMLRWLVKSPCASDCALCCSTTS